MGNSMVSTFDFQANPLSDGRDVIASGLFQSHGLVSNEGIPTAILIRKDLLIHWSWVYAIFRQTLVYIYIYIYRYKY